MSILKSQPIKIALGIILGLGTVIMIALAVDANSNDDISNDRARTIALNAAGVSEAELVSYSIDEARINGEDVYSIVFTTNDKEYRYTIERDDGDIISSSFTGTTIVETQNEENPVTSDVTVSGDNSSNNTITTPNTTNTSEISEAEAKTIVLNDAGVSENDLAYFKIEKDRDDGRLIYEIEFYASGIEYEYDILVSDGSIVKRDYENDNRGSTNTNIITMDEAKNIALSRVNGAIASNVYIELDHDDGYIIYEGEIYYGDMEYEFEIDASTGNIIKWSSERR